jgi:hypothetical protein
MRGLGSGDKLWKRTAKWGCFRKGREDGGNLLYMPSNKWSFGFKTTLVLLATPKEKKKKNNIS